MDRPGQGSPPKDKGKGRADVDTTPSSQNQNTKGKQPLGGGIVSSFVALTRDAAAPAGFAAGLSSLTSGKAGGPAGASTASAAEHVAAEAGRARGEASSSAASRAFREHAAVDSTGEDFEDFLYDEGPEYFQGATADGRHPWETGTFKDAMAPNGQDPWAYERGQYYSLQIEPGDLTGTGKRHRPRPLDEEPLPNYRDGGLVRQLLSDPEFVAITDAYDDEEPPPASELFPSNYTAEEQDAIEKIRRDLAAPPVHRPVPVDNPMNLMPNFEILPPHHGAEKDPIDMDMLQSAATRDQLLNEWSSVLRSYTDDVWGDLLPTIQPLQEELEGAKRGGVLDDKALARLRMVLNHVRNLPGQK